MTEYSRRLTKKELREVIVALDYAKGNVSEAARQLGMKRGKFRTRLDAATEQNVIHEIEEPGFYVSELPTETPSAQELLEFRKRRYSKKNQAKEARRLIEVQIKIDGPIGIAHFGDPHVDDDGTDLALLESHVTTIQNTKGLFGANVGDMHNNWVGRLGRLYGEQGTSAAEAWILVEWLVTSVQWLYLIGGNHDCWSGAGDPLLWMTRDQMGVFQAHGARLNLVFPQGKKLRINSRHDFQGHSMWNTAHGPAKAIQMGWRDHILTCGHKHTSGYQVLKCPASGLISHALRLASYKKWDRYAEEKGLPDQNIAPAFVTIIDPQYEDDDPRLITTVFDVKEGAEYLTFKRKKAGY